MLLMVVVEPLRVDRIGESGPGAVQFRLCRERKGYREQREYRKKPFQVFSPLSSI
jgi:hypothetical protein